MATPTEDVYCTLLMSDSYLPGAAVLAHSLRDCGTKKKLACLVTLDSLLYNTIHQLKAVFDYVIPVDKLANPHLDNLARLDRLDLRFAFTKIALWQQQQFRKIVYVDSDIVALRAPDELFDLPDSFAAAPDIGWPDCFNSGFMVLTPNVGDYWSLHTLASSGTSFDGADQGLLNQYFANRPWHRLSFTYNCTPSAGYQYEPAFRHFRSSISMAHFIGKDKPWTMGRRALSNSHSAVFRELLGQWWSTYDRHYRFAQSSALEALPGGTQHVRQFVKDEDSSRTQNGGMVNGKSPEALMSTTEMPMSAPDDQLDALGHMESHRAQDEPAPQNEWDATRSAPPTSSKPEAQAFPSQHYDMSSDPHLFQPPGAYPEPPSNMHYDMPPRPKTPEKPKPIFPWESQTHRPTRVFPAALPDPTAAEESSRPSTLADVPGHQDETTQKKSDAAATATPRTSAGPDASDGLNRTNAWDNDSSIEAYVRAVRHTQSSRGLGQAAPQEGAGQSVADQDFATTDLPPPRAKKPDSLVLTDFPTEVERPSLPVTPAPIRRPSFWGNDDDAGAAARRADEQHPPPLPSAHGVPEQDDWDPHERLERLRKASLATAADMPLASDAQSPSAVPLRTVIGSSLPGEAADEPSAGVARAGSVPVSSGGFGNTGFREHSAAAAAELGALGPAPATGVGAPGFATDAGSRMFASPAGEGLGLEPAGESSTSSAPQGSGSIAQAPGRVG